MAEILEFNQNAEFYRRKTNEYIKLDRTQSLLYARKAESVGDASDSFFLANILYQGGNFEQAADIYLRLYFAGVRTREVYVALIRCFYNMSDLTASNDVFLEAVDNGVLGRDIGNQIIDGELTYQGLFESIVPDDEDDKYPEIGTARSMYPVKRITKFGIVTYAEDIRLPADDVTVSARFAEALTIVVGMQMDKKSADTVLGLLNSALKVNPADVGILATKVLALVAKGNFDEAESVADELRFADIPENLYDLVKATMAFAAIDDNENVADYAEELLDYYDDENFLLLCAISSFNEGYIDRAKECLITLLRIDPDHSYAKHLLSKVSTVSDDISLPLSLNFQPLDITKRKQEVLSLLGGKEADADTKRDYYHWALTSADTDFAIGAGVEMIKTGDGIEIVEELLISTTVCGRVKRKWLAELLTKNKKKSCNYFIGAPRTISTKDYACNCSSDTKRIFYSALTVLIGKAYRYEKKLFTSFLNAQKMLENDEIFIQEDAAVGAVILKSRIRNFTKAQAVAELLNCNEKDIIAAKLAIYGDK